MEIKLSDIVLCEFYFSDIQKSKNRSVLVFKDNLPYDDFVAIPISSKIDNLQHDEVIIGFDAYQKYHKIFCNYFGCDKYIKYQGNQE